MRSIMAAIYEDNHHSRTLKKFYHDNCDLLLVYENCCGSIEEKWYSHPTVNFNEHDPCKNVYLCMHRWLQRRVPTQKG